jgi:hypothetical protein
LELTGLARVTVLVPDEMPEVAMVAWASHDALGLTVELAVV